jgi:hypothetical protein
VLFGGGEEGYKFVRGRTQVADATVRRQRAYVQQNSGGTLKFHVSIIAGLERCMSRSERTGPSGAKAHVDFEGLNVRAKARTLLTLQQLKCAHSGSHAELL